MLPMPQDPSTQISVMGIDPGTTTLGVGLIHFDLVSFQISSWEAYTFRGDKLTSNAWIGATSNDRLQRIAALKRHMSHMLHRVNPLAVACESGYINVRQPSAYGALMEIVSAIRDAVWEYDVWRPLYMVTPSQAKAAIGAKGNSGDKQAVANAIAANPELVSTCLMPLASLDEHSCDATAIAYYQYRSMVESRFVPLNSI